MPMRASHIDSYKMRSMRSKRNWLMRVVLRRAAAMQRQLEWDLFVVCIFRTWLNDFIDKLRSPQKVWTIIAADRELMQVAIVISRDWIHVLCIHPVCDVNILRWLISITCTSLRIIANCQGIIAEYDAVVGAAAIAVQVNWVKSTVFK